MQYVDCPIIGRRPYSEFAISGILEPEPAEIADMTPARWTFERRSLPVERTEWWYHTPSQLWFNVTRHTGTDTISRVVLAGIEPEDGS